MGDGCGGPLGSNLSPPPTGLHDVPCHQADSPCPQLPALVTIFVFFGPRSCDDLMTLKNRMFVVSPMQTSGSVNLRAHTYTVPSPCFANGNKNTPNLLSTPS